MSNETLSVRLIRLQNIGGIEELTIEPGAVTMLEGKNGRNKTSVVDGVLALLGSGSAADLLRDGAEWGEIYAELSDGTWFRRRITPTSNTLTAGHPEFGPISRAKHYLTSLISTAALDPAAFLRADDEKRAQMVVAAARIRVTPDEIAEAINPGLVAADTSLTYDANGHALEVIGRVHKIVYDMRTEVNAVAKHFENTLKDLRDSLPDGAPDGLVDTSALRQELDTLQRQVNAAEASIDIDTGERVKHLQQIRDDAIESARAEFERRCAEARAEYERGTKAALDHAKESVRALYARTNPQATELEASIKAAEQSNALAETFARTRKRIAEVEQEMATERQKSQALTETLARLDALKTAKASQLPLKKAEIRDGKLYLHTRSGVVPASRANQAERVKAALELCIAMSRGKVRFIVADSLECLDSDTRAQLERAAPKMGVQILATRVTDDDGLVVRKVGAA